MPDSDFRRNAVPLLHSRIVVVRDKSVLIQWVYEGKRSNVYPLPRAVCVDGPRLKVGDRNVRVGSRFYKEHKAALVPIWKEFYSILNATVITTRPDSIRIQWRISDDGWASEWIPRIACKHSEQIKQFDDDVEIEKGWMDENEERFPNISKGEPHV